MFWKPASFPPDETVHPTYRPETKLLLRNGGAGRLQEQRRPHYLKNATGRSNKVEQSPQLELGLEIDEQA